MRTGSGAARSIHNVPIIFHISEDQMSGRKVIAVVGGTGAQGGGLIRAILADPSGEFAARALTRDPNSEKAKALKKWVPRLSAHLFLLGKLHLLRSRAEGGT